MAIIKWMQPIKRISFLLGICLLFTAKNMNALHVAPRSRLTPEQQQRQKSRFIERPYLEPDKWQKDKLIEQIHPGPDEHQISRLKKRFHLEPNELQEDKFIEQVHPEPDEYQRDKFIKQASLEQDEWRVCGDKPGTIGNCIKVKRKVLESSNVIKNTLKDIGDGNKTDILINFPITVITDSFHLLNKSLENNGLESIKTEIQTYSFDKLITTFNCIHYLDCQNLEGVFLSLIKEKITENNGQITAIPVFQQLNPDAQKTLMVNPILNFLDSKSLEKSKSYLKVHTNSVISATFSPDGSKIVSSSWSNRNNLVLWDVATERQIHGLIDHNNIVHSVAFNPDNSKIVSGSEGNRNNLILWDINNLNDIKSRQLVGHSDGVISVAFSPDGKKIISGSKGNHNNLILWDISNLNNIRSIHLRDHPGTIHSARFSPDGNKIISCSDGNQNNLILWNISNLNNIELIHLKGAQDTVSSVAFSPDGKRIISGSDGNHNDLILWNISNVNDIKSMHLEDHSKSVTSVAFSPDGKKIISGHNDNHNNLILWNVKTGKPIYNLVGHTGPVISAVFSPDDSKIISCSLGNHNNLILWDVATGKQIHNLIGHDAAVFSAEFNSDSSRIVSGGYGSHDNLILWSMLSQQKKNIIKKCTVEQTALLYRLILTQQNTALKLNSTDQKLFDSLSLEIQNLLQELAIDKLSWRDWFVNNWKKIVGGTAAAGVIGYGLHKYTPQSK